MRLPNAIFATSLCLCLTAAAGTATRKPTGVIRGTVVDEHGVLVEKAVVRVTPMGVPLGYVSPWAETDAQGHFAIRNLDWGKWSTSASKPSEGYPDLPSDLYKKGGKFPVVVLSHASPAAEVQIQFAPKAGILTGRISDSVTGAHIQAGFEFRRHGSSRIELGMGQPSNYHVFLPASETMDMEVSAPSYRTAYFPALNLSSGEERKLDIELQPVAQEVRQHSPPRHCTNLRRIKQGTETGRKTYEDSANSVRDRPSHGRSRGQ